MRKAICSTAAFELPWCYVRAHSPGQQDMKLHLMRFPNLFCPTVSSHFGPNYYTFEISQLHITPSKAALSLEIDIARTSIQKNPNPLAHNLKKHTQLLSNHISQTRFHHFTIMKIQKQILYRQKASGTIKTSNSLKTSYCIMGIWSVWGHGGMQFWQSKAIPAKQVGYLYE